jgi:hypothetical protein
MMKVSRASILILAVCLAVNGCQPIIKPKPAGIPPAEEQILLDPGSATLAQDLEKAKPLVDLNREE